MLYVTYFWILCLCLDLAHFKGYGLAGASYSTVLIEVVGTVYLGLRVVQRCFLFDREFLQGMRPEVEAVSSILSQAVPAMLDLLTVQLGAFVVLYFVGWYGQEAVAAFGISIRIEQIALLPLIGIGYGVLTLTGQNFGAGNYTRIKETIICSFKLSLTIMLPIVSLVLIFRRELASIFTDLQYRNNNVFRLLIVVIDCSFCLYGSVYYSFSFSRYSNAKNGASYRIISADGVAYRCISYISYELWI